MATDPQVIRLGQRRERPADRTSLLDDPTLVRVSDRRASATKPRFPPSNNVGDSSDRVGDQQVAWAFVMREVIAYSTSAFVHVCVLGALAAVIDRPPQLLRVERGLASIESVASVAAVEQTADVWVQMPELPETPKKAPAEPKREPEELEPLKLAKQVTSLELARRDEAPELALADPPEHEIERADEQPPEDTKPPEPLPVRREPPPPKVEKVAEVDSDPSQASAASLASAGAMADELPQKIFTNPAPAYPADAQDAGWQGVVTLRVLVSTEGHAQQVSVETSSGIASLDASALATVRTWRFVPGQRQGRPIAAEVLVPVRFSLR
jgi:protein TonB